ncbi:hypothetical protein H2201_001375 [Coniosporium apollinis]|uniref:Major facilitator superfamily (MFS) profile domain-containing protein n=1 Tax=Coniosporium apollinis TaxID=61459 RepID=A0ABQ9P147_9PEZI|nr:hypothetical protein H2201_001375 [Coniosporium apollinis]
MPGATLTKNSSRLPQRSSSKKLPWLDGSRMPGGWSTPASDQKRRASAVTANHPEPQDNIGVAALQKAITDLENLMHEAAEVAEDVGDLARPVRPMPSSSSSSSGSEATFSSGRSTKSSNKTVLTTIPSIPTMAEPPSKESIAVDWAYMNKTPLRASSPLSSSPKPPPRQGTRVLRRVTPRPIADSSSENESPKNAKSFRRADTTRRHSTPQALNRRQSIPPMAADTGIRRRQRRHDGSDEKITPWEGDDKEEPRYYGSDPEMSEVTPRRRHMFSHGKNGSDRVRHHRRKPLARNWSRARKRVTAIIACINTFTLGYIIGQYAGEVPKIQYQLADQQHQVILGNVFLFIGLAISTFFFWPLPLLHGRRTYVLAALAIALPLQFPQALVINTPRSPTIVAYRVGLLLPRAISGFILGFANVNFITTLLDLYGASLQSSNPHQELVIINDVRRHGGGVGLWLGLWVWCFIGSVSLGFLTGAGIIADLNPAWGFYIIMILMASVLCLNIIAPETRRSPYRRSFTEVVDAEDTVHRMVARGEVKLHISTQPPKYWFDEVFAGIRLNFRMMFQPGFFILALYVGWIYAMFVLVIVLLGALLSREYRWYPHFVGLGVMSLAIGAFLAIPLTKAGLFSRARKAGPRTDSMTFQKRITCTSHLVRRVLFMSALPFVGMAYTLLSAGKPLHWMWPIFCAGIIGFLSNLAIAECYGLIMETFDTSDLQPGANSRHRLQSMASDVRRRRTNYSSFPRVTAGIMVSQTFAFLLAAAATGVGGAVTRKMGAQTATGITAGILLALTVLLTVVLWRWSKVQVIPNHAFGTRRNTTSEARFTQEDWKPVIIGNPSGKIRRMSLLELGAQSRWTEIRKLNKLTKEKPAV